MRFDVHNGLLHQRLAFEDLCSSIKTKSVEEDALPGLRNGCGAGGSSCHCAARTSFPAGCSKAFASAASGAEKSLGAAGRLHDGSWLSGGPTPIPRTAKCAAMTGHTTVLVVFVRQRSRTARCSRRSESHTDRACDMHDVGTHTAQGSDSSTSHSAPPRSGRRRVQ